MSGYTFQQRSKSVIITSPDGSETPIPQHVFNALVGQDIEPATAIKTLKIGDHFFIHKHTSTPAVKITSELAVTKHGDTYELVTLQSLRNEAIEIVRHLTTWPEEIKELIDICEEDYHSR